MQNLNDPKLTNQERQHILRLSIDKEYRQKYEKAKEHTDYIFQSSTMLHTSLKIAGMTFTRNAWKKSHLLLIFSY